MSVASSATSTELVLPESIGGKSFFSHRKENVILVITVFIVSLMMWTISPGIAILGLAFVVVYAIAGLSLNYQTGLTGIVNFGVVGFFAIGAYSVSLATLLGWNWFPAIIIGIIITCFISYLVGKSLLSLREDYFAIMTITLGEIIRFIFQKEDWIVYPPSQAQYWGGTKGLNPDNAIRNNLTNLNILNIIQFQLANTVQNFALSIRSALLSIGIPGQLYIHLGIPNWYYFTLKINIADMFNLQQIDAQNIVFVIAMTVFLVAGYIVFERIYNSPLGRLNKAIREDALAAESLGENVFNRQVNVFVLGNVLIAISGGFFAYLLTSITPDSFLPIFTFYIWAVVVLGGISNNRGTILGALIFGASIPLVSAINIKAIIQGFFGALMTPFIPSLLSIVTNFFNPAIKNWTNFFTFNLTWFLNLIINPIFNFNLFGLIIPLSTLFFFVLAVILCIIKFMTVTNEEFSQAFSTNRLLKWALNIVVILAVSVFMVNFIIKPPMTMVINLKFSTLFLFTIEVLILLIVIVAILIKFPLQSNSKGLIYTNFLQNDIIKIKTLKILIALLVITIIPIIFQDLPILPKPIFDKFNSAHGVRFVPISTFFVNLDPELARVMVIGIILMVFIMFKPEGLLKERQIKTVDSIKQYTEYYSTHLQTQTSDLKIPKAELSPDIDPNSDLLKTKDLTKSFGGVIGLDKVSITVKRGSLLGIIGPNGSGKSTFFNVLTGLLEQDKNQEGEIDFLNKDITYFSVSERAKLGMGRTFQQSRLFKNLTVLENVLVSAKKQKGTKLINTLIGNWKKEEIDLHQQAFQILQYLNILHIWNQKASDISGGQQKLVALARALMSQSHIILLDEPVAGVNPTLAKRIFEKIQELHLKEGTQYVIIEHNMDVQLSFCDQIVVFNKGQIVAEGSPEEIRKNETVLDAYLGH